MCTASRWLNSQALAQGLKSHDDSYKRLQSFLARPHDIEHDHWRDVCRDDQCALGKSLHDGKDAVYRLADSSGVLNYTEALIEHAKLHLLISDIVRHCEDGYIGTARNIAASVEYQNQVTAVRQSIQRLLARAQEPEQVTP